MVGHLINEPWLEGATYFDGKRGQEWEVGSIVKEC